MNTNTNTTNASSVSSPMNATIDKIDKIDSINYITLETMANSDTYNKYLKRNNLDHISVLKSEKRFYRKRIAAMAKDILNNNVNNNSDSPINDVIITAFNTNGNRSPLIGFLFSRNITPPPTAILISFRFAS